MTYLPLLLEVSAQNLFVNDLTMTTRRRQPVAVWIRRVGPRSFDIRFFHPNCTLECSSIQCLAARSVCSKLITDKLTTATPRRRPVAVWIRRVGGMYLGSGSESQEVHWDQELRQGTDRNVTAGTSQWPSDI